MFCTVQFGCCIYFFHSSPCQCPYRWKRCLSCFSAAFRFFPPFFSLKIFSSNNPQFCVMSADYCSGLLLTINLISQNCFSSRLIAPLSNTTSIFKLQLKGVYITYFQYPDLSFPRPFLQCSSHLLLSSHHSRSDTLLHCQ